MFHALLVLLFFVPILVLYPLAWVLVLTAYVLGGSDADGGLAGLLFAGAEGISSLLNKMHATLSSHKPVALTFNGAVRYWRKNLEIASDIDTKNWEYMADLKRSAIQKLPVGFDYGSKNANSFHKQFRFAKYVIGKRVKVSDTDQDQSVVLNA